MTRPGGASSEDNSGYTVTDNWLTIPNLVTLVRLLLVPVFVWVMFHDRYWDALIILIILFSTDWIDGYLARKLDQVTTVGKWLDPFADRLSLWVVIITVVATGLAPLWLIFALMIPDLVLAGLMVLIYTGNPQMEVTILGKARTVALMLGVPLLLFAEAPFIADPQLWHAVAIGVLGLGAEVISLRAWTTCCKAYAMRPKCVKSVSTPEIKQIATPFPNQCRHSCPKVARRCPVADNSTIS